MEYKGRKSGFDQQKQAHRRYLKSIGILDESQLKGVLKSQIESGNRLSDILNGIGFLQTEQLRDLIVQEFSLVRTPIFDRRYRSTYFPK
jgi:hypothetical protein